MAGDEIPLRPNNLRDHLWFVKLLLPDQLQLLVSGLGVGHQQLVQGVVLVWMLLLSRRCRRGKSEIVFQTVYCGGQCLGYLSFLFQPCGEFSSARQRCYAALLLLLLLMLLLLLSLLFLLLLLKLWRPRPWEECPPPWFHRRRRLSRGRRGCITLQRHPPVGRGKLAQSGLQTTVELSHFGKCKKKKSY